MNWTDVFSYLCLALYALATVASLAGVLGRSARVKKLACLLCTGGFALHSLWLVCSLAGGAFSDVSRGFYLLPLSWFLALTGLLMSRRQNMDIVLHFVAPWAFFLGALDRVNALATLIGFPCYSLGVLCGFLWARISWGSFMSGDFKEWISLLILAVYALLFHQRQALGWRGRKPAILAIIIFAASLFSMFVVNTVLSTQHGF